MTKYCLSIVRGLKRNDGLTKPKTDINNILKKEKFVEIKQLIYKTRQEKIFSVKNDVSRLINKFKSNDVLLVNYPTDMGYLFDRTLLNKLRSKQVKSIAFIHDIDALRFQMPFYKGLKHEITLLNKYTCVIVPNSTMLRTLKKQGLRVPTVTLQLFDYLTEQDLSTKKINYAPIISFTGNLNKAGFIFNLKNSNSISYELYGPLEADTTSISDMYQGSFDSDQLLQIVNKGFGLIWDGASIECIDTAKVSSGSYLMYNNPYKLSFYIATGVPIVIWSKAAEANFVIENKIGIVVDSLKDLEKEIKKISEQQYEEMKQNVKIIQNQVLNGNYTTRAIDSALDIINKR